MPEPPVAIVGVVLAPDPVEIGPATWTYTLSVTYPDGGTGTMPDVVPANARPPTELDARSVPPGTAVQGFAIAGQSQQWFIYELPDFGPCPGTGNGEAAGVADTPGSAQTFGPPGLSPPAQEG
jgi:hypothetical protein